MDDTVIKPLVQKRDEFGLIEGLVYKFKDEGRRVDWRAMVPEKYLVPNRQYFERMNLPLPASNEGLEDKQLLILLDGIKYLADLRGYEYISYDIDSNVDRTTIACKIQWTANYETEFHSKISSGVGDASFQNTSGFGNLFLGPIAENRAFVRAVRNFLKIEILGKDEVDGVKMENANSNPNVASTPTESQENKEVSSCKALMKKKKVTFDLLKSKLVAEGVPGAETFTCVEDLPKPILFNMIERLGKKRAPKE